MAIYMWREIQPITTAWIYHNADLWLISISSNWSSWLTIADKNLGATTVWNIWDTLSESNCWKYYQRWNNYWFPFTWTVTTSSTQVNASNYWPWNYYSSSTFITQSSRTASWMYPFNADLWGNTTNTNVARKWPCDTWFHVPSPDDFTSLRTMWINIWAWTDSVWTNFWKYLKIPKADVRWNNWTVYSQWNNWQYWTSAASNNYATYYLFHDAANNFNFTGFWPVMWLPIRPFKNEAVQPYTNWTVIYQ